MNKYQDLANELSEVEHKIYMALEREIENSKLNSKHISYCKAIKVNVFDYTELVKWDDNLIFLDRNGHHYNIGCEATLDDLIDILNNI